MFFVFIFILVIIHFYRRKLFFFSTNGKGTLDCTLSIWKDLVRCFHSISLPDLIDQRQSCI